MATDFKILGKGLKQLAILLLLIIASPILLSLAFKALAVYKEGTGLIVSWIFSDHLCPTHALHNSLCFSYI